MHPDEWEAGGHRVRFGDLELFVRDVAAGTDTGRDPLLVLHGFPTSSYDWHLTLDALSADRRVVLFDFPGFGLSDKPDRRYGIRFYADAAETVAAATGLERGALVTHDLGDSVGGELLRRDLEGTLRFEIAQRVLTNGSIYMDLVQLSVGQQLLLDAPDETLDLAALGLDPRDGFRNGVAGTCSVRPSDAELDAAWRFVSYQDGHKLLTRTIRYIEDRRAEEDRYTGAIEGHRSPLAVVWGREDPIAVHAMAQRVVDRVPGTPLRTLDGIGHYPMLEAPEPFAAAVRAFLDR